MTPAPRIVYLVGAGPGDPGLITVRGLKLLRLADVVVHDRLIPHSLLAKVRPDARLIDVGKTPDRPGISQEQINAILVDEARAGRSVVRLKGGDPFVFGRGFEELTACREAGISCVVVPGVSSAIAAPAAAGIPITHRGIARSVAIVTARSGDDGKPAMRNFTALAEMDTLIVLMGRAGLREFVDGLVASGKSPDTPAACIERGTMPQQQVVRATLTALPDAADRANLQPPIVTVIGDVAALGTIEIGEALSGASFDRPLAEKRVVVTRADSSSSQLVGLLNGHGATVIECPLIRIAYPPRHEAFAGALNRLQSYDWLVLTSLHAARALRRALREANLDARALAGCKIASIGPATTRALRRIGITPDLVPTEHTADAFVEALSLFIHSKRILLLRSDIALAKLPRRLRDLGATVDEVVAYQTRPATPSAAAIAEMHEGADAIVFCSPSAVHRYVELNLPAIGAAIACIGPTTAQAARDAGLSVDLVAQPHTSQGLVHALIDHFQPIGAHL